MFWTKKTFLPGFLRILFFPVFSGVIFHRNVVLERSQVFFFAVTGIFHRNSCGTGFPVFTPESSRGFRRIRKDSCSHQKLLALASD